MEPEPGNEQGDRAPCAWPVEDAVSMRSIEGDSIAVVYYTEYGQSLAPRTTAHGSRPWLPWRARTAQRRTDIDSGTAASAGAWSDITCVVGALEVVVAAICGACGPYRALVSPLTTLPRRQTALPFAGPRTAAALIAGAAAAGSHWFALYHICTHRVDNKLTCCRVGTTG